MQKITIGELRVFTYSHIYTFPAPGSPAAANNPKPNLKAELRVVNDVFWVRLCTMSDLGFAEAYMYGDVECDDLVTLFQASMFLLNRENLAGLNSSVSYLFTLPQKLTSYRFVNTISNSRSNISAHYDISNDMFKGFLSEDMTYSCAIFEDLDGDVRDGNDSKWSGGANLQRVKSATAESPKFSSSPAVPTPLPEASVSASTAADPLHAAQLRKLHHIIQKARIFPHQRVLEIGSGWGSLAILIAQSVPHTTVDTLTLSSQQLALARQRIDAAGLSGRVRVHLMDYRAMPAEWAGAFDRVVSVEMIEAVGQEFLGTFWETVDWAMKKDDAVGVVQVITIPEPRYERYIREIDFIRKWVLFPGGFLPTLTLLMTTLSASSSGRLIVDSVSNIGPHYARTLREWRRRFLERFDTVVVPALKREYPDVMDGPRGLEEIEVFKRKWICTCYCEVGFTTRTLGDHIITFAREGYEDYGCNVYQ
ncbi:hypothetical protein PLICRDRAFT_114061 [Plicaturopsis crispa FD-325 SS-3]|nr:hypothetical protein PLICRDRAFT_114061 [Plicaturopsis crispa FD-325 SS-3]